MQPMRGPATYADLASVPDTHVGQIIAGELLVQPRPSMAHSAAASVLGMDVGGSFDRGRGGPGGWWIRDEPELHLHMDILVPDLAGWRRARVPHLPSGPFVTIAPDWVCEVLSPSTAAVDRVRKMPIYLREGVRHVWLVDPERQTLEVFRLEHERWVLVGAHGGDGGDGPVRAEPFDEIELELSALWPAGAESG
ncbi:MAG: Uma2 family endonuclease [Myxococcales bacterium]|nr:Uma2 family endonuclease [Myxococcales bacterium]